MPHSAINQNIDEFMKKEFFLNQYNPAFRGLENMQTKITELQKYVVSFLSAVYAGVYYLLSKFTDYSFVNMIEGLAAFSAIVALFWLIQIICLQNKARFKANLIREMENDVPFKYMTKHQEHNKEYEVLYYVCDFFMPFIVLSSSIICMWVFK